MRFLKCEFYGNEDFKNVDFGEIEVFKIQIFGQNADFAPVWVFVSQKNREITTV